MKPFAHELPPLPPVPPEPTRILLASKLTRHLRVARALPQLDRLHSVLRAAGVLTCWAHAQLGHASVVAGLHLARRL